MLIIHFKNITCESKSIFESIAIGEVFDVSPSCLVTIHGFHHFFCLWTAPEPIIHNDNDNDNDNDNNNDNNDNDDDDNDDDNNDSNNNNDDDNDNDNGNNEVSIIRVNNK